MGGWTLHADVIVDSVQGPGDSDFAELSNATYNRGPRTSGQGQRVDCSVIFIIHQASKPQTIPDLCDIAMTT
jgi:hypothetical protein